MGLFTRVLDFNHPSRSSQPPTLALEICSTPNPGPRDLLHPQPWPSRSDARDLLCQDKPKQESGGGGWESEAVSGHYCCSSLDTAEPV